MSIKLTNVNDVIPSNFVLVVDEVYKNKLCFPNVWGISCAHDFEGWFSNCPFKMKLIEFCDVEDEYNATEDELWTIIELLGKVKRDDKIWGQLMKNTRLSWIVVNKRTRKVDNVPR